MLHITEKHPNNNYMHTDLKQSNKGAEFKVTVCEVRDWTAPKNTQQLYR